MKKFLKIFFSIILILAILGIIFGMVDVNRVYNGEEPIFTLLHKMVDGIDYSAKVDTGLGYKIIRFDILNQPEMIKVGSIFMDENPPYVEKIDENKSGETVSGESGEEAVKITTFGEEYKDIVMIEGQEQEIDVKRINSKLGYSMTYYYELFGYTGFDDHDLYPWNLSSGDNKPTMTVYDISNEEAYKDALDKIEKEKIFEEISGEVSGEKNIYIEKSYRRAFEQDSIKMVNYIYLMNVDGLKLMVDLYLTEEAEEGIGVYMHKMANSIEAIKLN